MSTPTTPVTHALRITVFVNNEADKLRKRVEDKLGFRPGPDGWHWVAAGDIDTEARFRVRDEYIAAGWEVAAGTSSLRLRPAAAPPERE